jgi:hypothetical protein
MEQDADLIKKITEEVKTSISEISSKNPGERAAWTAAVKNCLADIAKRHGLECSYTQKHGKKKEWLYDFIMYSVKTVKDNPYYPNGKMLDKVYLCAESEWNGDIDSIQEDFEKLLVTNAPVRLMVYTASDTNQKKYTGWLKTMIEDSPMTEPATFILAVCKSDDTFEVETVPAQLKQ